LNVKREGLIHPWKKWGAYLSERAWGSVREDYSENGDAWSYLSHDMARSKAYRWGEDGIAGFSDYFQTVLFSLAFWNGKDPILKERLFGLNPYEGNHAEDVKECYYYLDATPTQSYLKYLYKYPHAEFPYTKLLDENKRRSALDREYEIYDTGVFNEGRYFDIFVEYAKLDPEDICIKIEVWNRGPEKATLHILPHFWFRNRWSWTDPLGFIPAIREMEAENGVSCLYADPRGLPLPLRIPEDYQVQPMYLYGATPNELLFTHNDTHNERVWGAHVTSRTPYVKDAFHRYVIQKEPCVNPEKHGSKACFHYGPVEIPAQKSYVLLMRLTSKKTKAPLKDVESVITNRKKEADEFYSCIQQTKLSNEDKLIQRTALAGMIWSQQLYVYDVKKWIKGDNAYAPPPTGRGKIRNGKWAHLYAADVISMPDKWEYPWFAAWDLAFQTLALSLADMELAKDQLLLLLRHWFQHVNGQIPAYEWNFSDLNPPVQAWALWKLYQEEERRTGKGDHEFLLFGFLKLVQNFNWWVNKVDRLGNNFFEGGFLGLDNISVIDRSKPLPDGGMIEQSDATGWMGFYSLTMMRIALELAKADSIYESLATNFFEQFIYISSTIHETHDMWDEEDGFFYDIILYPKGAIQKLKIRSFVGIIPFYSLTFLEEEQLKKHPRFYERFLQFREYNKERVDRCVTKVGKKGEEKYIFSLMDLDQMKKVLSVVFNPNEFFSDYGLRSVSKFHEAAPLIFENSKVGYEPGESLERIKGGNSNWRGPIWFPTNYLFIDALHKLIECVGEDYEIELFDGSKGKLGPLHVKLKQNLVDMFRKNKQGFRPIHGDCRLYQEDPHWKELILFYEHYHGDTGRGLGASHQTGWSGLVANLIDFLE
jgi:hypothetical protein